MAAVAGAGGAGGPPPPGPPGPPGGGPPGGGPPGWVTLQVNLDDGWLGRPVIKRPGYSWDDQQKNAFLVSILLRCIIHQNVDGTLTVRGDWGLAVGEMALRGHTVSQESAQRRFNNLRDILQRELEDYVEDNGNFPGNTSLGWRIARVRNLSVDGLNNNNPAPGQIMPFVPNARRDWVDPAQYQIDNRNWQVQNNVPQPYWPPAQRPAPHIVVPPAQQNQSLAQPQLGAVLQPPGLPGNPIYGAVNQQGPAPVLANPAPAQTQMERSQQINQHIQLQQDQIFQSMGQQQRMLEAQGQILNQCVQQLQAQSPPRQPYPWYATGLPGYYNTPAPLSSSPPQHGNTPPAQPLYPSPPSPPQANYFNPGQNVAAANVNPFQPVEGQGYGPMNTSLAPQSSPGPPPYYGTPTPSTGFGYAYGGAQLPPQQQQPPYSGYYQQQQQQQQQYGGYGQQPGSNAAQPQFAQAAPMYMGNNSPAEGAALATAMGQGIPTGHQNPNGPLNALIDPQIQTVNPADLMLNNSNQNERGHGQPLYPQQDGRFGAAGQQQLPQQQQQQTPQHPPDGGNDPGYDGMADADEDPKEQEVDEESDDESEKEKEKEGPEDKA